MSLDAFQLADFVIQPVLNFLDPDIKFSKAAVQLVLGTAITESYLTHIDQIGPLSEPGPAYGLWQMEALTLRDIVTRAPTVIKSKLLNWAPHIGYEKEPEILHGNLFLGAATCRLKYFLAPDAIPQKGDARGMAELWKKIYNTPLGAGVIERALPSFERACRYG